ncbi:MAG: type II secretion system F family protein [Alphaproteobacteria bacterium]|nr:type II secretion system F family protein [Alphaproteobacteria bacterium]
MPSFRWSALNGGGEVVRGFMEADDRKTVIARLQRQGQIVLRAEADSGLRGWRDLLSLEVGRRRGLSKTALADITGELATMLGAGLDLDRALRFVVDTAAKPRHRAILGQIRDKVHRGSSLAGALAAEPHSFPKLYVGLVRAGEASGTLAATLARLAALIERERGLAASVRSALIYPALLVVAATASVVLLLEFVLPQFAPIFEQAGAQLPTPTRVLLAVGQIVGAMGPWLVLVLLIAALAGRRLLQRPALRLRWDAFVLRLPVIGQLVRETLAARLSRTLATLLQNGVPLIAALGIAEEALDNRAAVAAVQAGAEAARRGGGLARALGARGVFPPRTIQLLALGEETAQLPEMAFKAAEIHEAQVRLRVERLVALMVPTITIVMGILIGGIIVSLVTAMLRLNDLVV